MFWSAEMSLSLSLPRAAAALFVLRGTSALEKRLARSRGTALPVNHSELGLRNVLRTTCKTKRTHSVPAEGQPASFPARAATQPQSARQEAPTFARRRSKSASPQATAAEGHPVDPTPHTAAQCRTELRSARLRNSRAAQQGNLC